MKINKKYKPLFDLIAGKLPHVTTCVIIGGRESGKTFTTGLGLGEGVVNYGHRILYTRYTMKSASKSIIPAFQNRLELMNYGQFVDVKKESIESRVNKGRVDFAGIKTSSGNQTANLKSLEDYSILIIDEAEEWVNQTEFEDIELSLRSKDVAPFTIIVMNPSDISHFVYTKFFEPNKIPNGFNGIVGDTLYISTNYLDIGEENVAKKNWDKFEKARKVYEAVENVPIESRDKLPKSVIKTWKFYKYKVLGHWNSQVDNLCIEDYELFDEWPEEDYDYKLYGIDFGMSPDPTVLMETRVYGDKIYCKEHVYKQNMSNNQIVKEYLKLEPESEHYIIADSAGKNQIHELQLLNLPITKCKKGPDSIKAGIKKINSKELFVERNSKNAIFELNNYNYVAKVNNLGEIKVAPVDKNNHFIDSLRYTLTFY